MTKLIIDIERFQNGGYSLVFQSVIEALQRNGTILSEEASLEAYKIIYDTGVKATQEVIKLKDSKFIEKRWNKLKTEL